MRFDRSRDVVSLMLSKLDVPGADNFGRENAQRRSLLLDTVMQGRPRASSCKLLQLPAEILADIVDLLSEDRTSLGSLALVNSDCQQLARCCQFAGVTFDYSLQAKQLASHLVQDRSCQLRKPGIGACIRRVTFASHPLHVKQTHTELFEAWYGHTFESVTDQKRHALYNQAGGEYVAARTIAVEAISSLPNLEALSWKDQYSLDKNFFEKITRCSAQRIDLDGPAIDDAWLLAPPLTPSIWPLRSLKLDVSMALEKKHEIEDKRETEKHPMTNFFSTLFHLCSQTLESLTWTHVDLARMDGVLVSIGDTAVSFPRLRYFKTDFVELDSVAISSFLAAPLKSLDLDHMVLQNPSTFACQSLRDLEDFVVSFPPRHISSCKRIAKFLSQHTGLHRLYFHEASADIVGIPFLDDIILPTLNSCDFGNLRSLHLAWGESQIPRGSLQRIGQLVSLEQLSLSAGNSDEPRRRWLVDHDELRRRLRQLQRLTKLAIVQDTYPVSIPHVPCEYYYEFRMPRDGWIEDADLRPDLDPRTYQELVMEATESDAKAVRALPGYAEWIWERAHRNRMLDQADKYAAILPKLEWMFCGQRPIGYTEAPEGQCELRRAVPSTKWRDQCRTYLAQTFRGSG
ncbi:hypothetical protein F52700_6548 [Fusarium sp. NRRL 52700]|nr:hypothetical protein F52700_6548 [Fusarium sp. NRRL 52700]